MPKKVPIVQIEPGKWYAFQDYDRTECCDCGLIHLEEFKVEKGRLYFRTTRDDRATREVRKRSGITITRKAKG